jgi:hypothetical protein
MALFTLVHVVISLIGIITGLVVLGGLLSGKRLDGWTGLFLLTTIVTNLTGYGFPVDRVLPSHIVGAISLVALAIACMARYGYRLAGGWRKAYVVTAVLSLYLNVFVLIVQTFQKVPALRELAPTQSEPPFAISQLIVLVMFGVLGYRAVVSFRESSAASARQYL